MSYISHHANLALKHELRPDDINGFKLEYSPDAELGGDLSTTKKPRMASGWKLLPKMGLGPG